MAVSVEFKDTSDVVWKDTSDVRWYPFVLEINVHDCGETKEVIGG